MNKKPDIQQIEKENRQLKQKLKYYSSLLQNQNDAVIIHDFDGNIIAWDKGAETIFGWEQKELLSSSIYDIIPIDKRDDYKTFVQQVKSGEDLDYFETQKIAKDNKVRDVWLTYKVLGGENPNAIATTERDITERKKAAETIRKSEEKYQTLLNSLGDGVILLDDNFEIILTNPAAEKILFLSEEDRSPINIREFLDQKHLDILREHLLEHRGEVDTFELEITRKDGEPRLIQITLSTPKEQLEEEENTLCIIRDVTDIRKMEEDLIKTDKLESLGLLAGGIAHDFNNILSIINGNITLAKMVMDNKEKLTERLDRIATANERAKQLTTQISTLSKGHSVNKMQISPEKLVKESINLTLKTKKVDYSLDIDENLPTFLADEGQLSQVLNNLFINASHAIDQRTGKVRISVNQVALKPENQYTLPPGDYIKIQVKDNGCGIPEQNLKKIFDPYFTTKQTGTGLGLSTSISIINKHKGKMTVDSKVNVGTTFDIILPITQRDRKHREETLFKSNGTVLFMDDEDSINSIAELFFKKLNYEISLAKEGQEAVDLYKKHLDKGKPFDYVFLDLNIPNGMDGFECAEELLKLNPDAKIIAVSGNLVLSKYKQHGFIKALKKPFRISNIQTILKEI
ncbi:MAG: PAS domain S-box protein [Fidelibacterota bacterium]